MTPETEIKIDLFLRRAFQYRKGYIRVLALLTEEKRLKQLWRQHSMLMCVNGGNGLGAAARAEYNKRAAAYNKARHKSLLAPLLATVPQTAPPCLNQLPKED